MTEHDVEALGRLMTDRLREIACICPEPGCHFCSPPEVYWPTFRAAVAAMTSAAAAEFLRAERARRIEQDERTRARRRSYARHRAAVIRLDGWEKQSPAHLRPATPSGTRAPARAGARLAV
jgi:hypothetical protein